MIEVEWPQTDEDGKVWTQAEWQKKCARDSFQRTEHDRRLVEETHAKLAVTLLYSIPIIGVLAVIITMLSANGY
jgi:hypothetical protein